LELALLCQKKKASVADLPIKHFDSSWTGATINIVFLFQDHYLSREAGSRRCFANIKGLGPGEPNRSILLVKRLLFSQSYPCRRQDPLIVNLGGIGLLNLIIVIS